MSAMSAIPVFGELDWQQDREQHFDALNVHVGKRVCLRRTSIGMSQEQLGETLGLTLQQVQEYERGVTRVGSAYVIKLSHVLGVPISFFYDS